MWRLWRWLRRTDELEQIKNEAIDMTNLWWMACGVVGIPGSSTGGKFRDAIKNLKRTGPDEFIMQEIGALIRTQDNRATSDPMFIVQQRVRIYGLDLDYTDDYVWVDNANDYDEAGEIEAAGLDALDAAGVEIKGDWAKVGYRDQWDFVTACFTEKGCRDYIEANGHNLTDPRIYVASAYRNEEFNAVRKVLASMAVEE